MFTKRIIFLIFVKKFKKKGLKYLKLNYYYYFAFSYLQVEKVLFLCQIFEVEIFMDLHVLRSPESENHIFSVWSVCLCDSMCLCYQHNSKTNFSRNIKFGILHLYHVRMILEGFVLIILNILMQFLELNNDFNVLCM